MECRHDIGKWDQQHFLVVFIADIDVPVREIACAIGPLDEDPRQGESPVTGLYQVENLGSVTIDQDLAGAQFDQFRHKPKSNGDPNWASSWNSKSARDMSEASPDKMRTKQYKVLFSAWSEQAHGTPGAVIGQMMREDMRAVDSVRAREEVVTRSMETLAMALTLFVELWMNLGNVSQPKLEQFMEWFARLNEVTGPRIRAEFAPPTA